MYMRNSPPLVNERIFDFITVDLYDRDYEWHDEIRLQYTQ